MTVREIIERVQSNYQKGVSSDDSRLSNRLIYSTLTSLKALLMQQLISKRGKVSERNLDYLECIEMEKAEPHDCPCAPPSGCVILKSKCKLPKPITSKYGDYIQGVTSVDGTKTFSKTTWLAKAKKKGNKYTASTQDYFFKNDYLYITTPTVGGLITKIVTVSGIFTDPLSYSCDYCEECNKQDEIPGDNADSIDCKNFSYLDKEFKIDSELEYKVVELASEGLIKKFRLPGYDEDNDAQDNIADIKQRSYPSNDRRSTKAQ